MNKSLVNEVVALIKQNYANIYLKFSLKYKKVKLSNIPGIILEAKEFLYNKNDDFEYWKGDIPMLSDMLAIREDFREDYLFDEEDLPRFGYLRWLKDIIIIMREARIEREEEKKYSVGNVTFSVSPPEWSDEKLDHIPFLIHGYIHQTLTEAQEVELADWINVSNDNQILFDEMIKI